MRRQSIQKLSGWTVTGGSPYHDPVITHLHSWKNQVLFQGLIFLNTGSSRLILFFILEHWNLLLSDLLLWMCKYSETMMKSHTEFSLVTSELTPLFSWYLLKCACLSEDFFFISTSVKAAKFKISPLLIALYREQLFMLIPKYLLRYQVGWGAPWGQECWGVPMGSIRAGSGSQVPSHSPGRSRAASGSPGQSQPRARRSGS